MKVPEYAESICYINRHIKETGAELVINFYELLTGLTYFFSVRQYLKSVSAISTCSFTTNSNYPKEQMQPVFPEFLYATDCIGVLTKLALSFRSMPEDNHQHISVVPPLLRQDVLQQESKPGDYIHGYMLNAGFSENILNWHKNIQILLSAFSGTIGKKNL